MKKLPVKFAPTIPAILLYVLLLAAALLLFAGRKKAGLRITFLEKNFSDFYQHISNFSISYILFAGVSFIWLLMGVKLRYVLYFGILIILINFIFELWINVLNTADITDAWYGVAGVVLGLVYLAWMSRYGVREMRNN